MCWILSPATMLLVPTNFSEKILHKIPHVSQSFEARCLVTRMETLRILFWKSDSEEWGECAAEPAARRLHLKVICGLRSKPETPNHECAARFTAPRGARAENTKTANRVILIEHSASIDSRRIILWTGAKTCADRQVVSVNYQQKPTSKSRMKLLYV